MSNDNFSHKVCSLRSEIIGTIKQFREILKVRKFYDREIYKVVIEEAVSLQWKKLKQNTKKAILMYDRLQETAFWNIPRMREMAEFFYNHLDKKILGPCEFSHVLMEFLDKENIHKNLNFLEWLFSSPSRCIQAFQKRKL